LIAETFLNPDIVVRSAYHFVDFWRIQALVARLQVIAIPDICVGLRSSDHKCFHFSEFTLGQNGTNAELQRELLAEASASLEYAGYLTAFLSEWLPACLSVSLLA
jgi:hypothetical protein